MVSLILCSQSSDLLLIFLSVKINFSITTIQISVYLIRSFHTIVQNAGVSHLFLHNFIKQAKELLQREEGHQLLLHRPLRGPEFSVLRPVRRRGQQSAERGPCPAEARLCPHARVQGPRERDAQSTLAEQENGAHSPRAETTMTAAKSTWSR